MRALLEGLNQRFVQQGIAPANRMYIAYQPPTPDEAISIYTRGDTESDTRSAYDSIGLQVLIRNAATGAGAVKSMDAAQAVYDTLHGIGAETINGIYVVSIIGIQGGPIFIGRDSNGRAEYSINFRAEVINPARVEVGA